MALAAERTDFTLRDPSALGALLIYDWRFRKLLTDDEVISDAVDRPVSTGILRHLQRLGFIKAVHGVRPHGGRMRLWPMEEVLKLQIALDVRQATGARLSACVEALVAEPALLGAALEDWEAYVGGPVVDERSSIQLASGAANLMEQPEALQRLALASVRAFISRSRFDQVSAPAFLL